MKPIFDYEMWVGAADLDNHEEIYNLYQAVSEVTQYGQYKCSIRPVNSGNQYFVSCPHVAEPLLLATEIARTSFLNYINDKYAGKDWDMESWYNYESAMSATDKFETINK